MIQQLKNTLSKRIVVISLLGLSMLIPLGLVQNVIHERGYYYDSVIHEIANLWGSEQTIQGPLIVVPFVEKFITEEKVKNDDGQVETKSRTRLAHRRAIFLPKTLKINSDIAEDYRSRSIYKSLVYSANLTISAEFERPDLSALSSHIHEIQWHKARIVVGLSDTKSIDDISHIQWQDTSLDVAAGTGMTEVIQSGFQAPIKIDQPMPGSNKENYAFSVQLKVKGSQSFRFTPFGETTQAQVSSSWPHPKFSGNVLPDDHSISADGFTANWQIPHLARNYPQSWIQGSTQPELFELVAGVDLHEPVFIYSKITRAVKYGLLFIGLTFLTFLAVEISIGSALHYVQYALIGLALALFYLLLLSLSEHLRFYLSYLIAALACITMISTYAGTALQNRRQGKFLFGLLSIVFALLYALLNMEDYALLVGAWVLFVAIGVMMYLTRRISASEEKLENQSPMT